MIVMKFGGTSVQDVPAVQRVVQIIKSHMPQNPVIVVSAMGKTTKRLLEVAMLSASGKGQVAIKNLQEIRIFHSGIAGGVVEEWSNTEGCKRIDGYFDEISKLLDGLSILGELSPRSQDKILSYGELISTSIMAETLSQHGMASVWLDSRNLVVTDEHFTNAFPLSEETYTRVRKSVQSVVENGKVPVLQGYIGSSKSGGTTTLGFEGSDFSAALIGAALDVSEIQIWKDVSGVMTADPEMVPDARTVKSLSYEEAAELTFFGAKILHPKSIQPAMNKNIPVVVLNSKAPNQTGSQISDGSLKGNSYVKSIAYKKPLCLVKIRSKRILPVEEFYQAVMEALTRESMVPFVLSTAENSIAAAFGCDGRLESLKNHLTRLADVDLIPQKAAITIVGHHLQFKKNITTEIFSILQDQAIDLISYGASGTSMTWIIEESSVKNVLNLLHSVLFRKWDPELFG